MKKIKEFLKKFFWIKFFHLYLRQLYLKIFYSSIKAKERYIEKYCKKYIGYEINFNKKPETFCQKIQFRKLYDNNPLYSICADKYRVREYVKGKIGEEYLIPLYLVTDKLTKEQWNQLPNSFVAKANHNSGPVQIIKDKNKVNKKEVIRELNYQLKLDFGILSMEKYYSDIPRKIVVEKFLENKGEKDLRDYKFYCFNGKVEYCQLIKNRTTDETIDFYNKDWERQEFTGLSVIKKSLIKDEKPKNYKLMIDLANKLANCFDFVRVDFYNVDGKIYFGELTFCPSSGFGKFVPEEWNSKIGNLWKQKEFKKGILYE